MPFRSKTHALFQARLWREYAAAWDGPQKSVIRVDREWVERVLKVPRDECLRRARSALEACRSLESCPLPE